MTVYIIGGIILYFLGMAVFRCLCFYLFGTPNGQQCDWWKNTKDEYVWAHIGYPLVFFFMLARLIGVHARMRLLEKTSTKPDDLIYKVGAWKDGK